MCELYSLNIAEHAESDINKKIQKYSEFELYSSNECCCQ